MLGDDARQPDASRLYLDDAGIANLAEAHLTVVSQAQGAQDATGGVVAHLAQRGDAANGHLGQRNEGLVTGRTRTRYRHMSRLTV